MEPDTYSFNEIHFDSRDVLYHFIFHYWVGVDLLPATFTVEGEEFSIEWLVDEFKDCNDLLPAPVAFLVQGWEEELTTYEDVTQAIRQHFQTEQMTQKHRFQGRAEDVYRIDDLFRE